ncbi:MAG: SDR family NAD(P)-dependent oxidoreductase [archaeon]
MTYAGKVLVTGSNGFAGSHLVDRLLTEGYNVFGTYRLGASLENLASALDNGMVHVVMDICDSDRVENIVRGIAPDYIFHLASQTSTPKSFQYPERTFEVNLNGTVNLLDALMATHSSAHTYVVLSQEAFGSVKPDEIPIRDDTPCRPNSPYGISKAMQQMVTQQYVASYGVNAVCLRPFTHSGPRQRRGFLFPDWAYQVAMIEARKQKPVINVGNLDAVRDYLHISDVIDAYISVIGKGEPGAVYNICAGIETPVRVVLDEMISQAHTRKQITVEIDPKKMRPSDTPIFVGDHSKFTNLTGWNPRINVGEIVRDVLDYWRSQI